MFPSALPSAILVSDLHIRSDNPSCRTDNFVETQIKKLQWLKGLQNKFKNQPPIIIAGDIFHKAKPNPLAISIALEHLPEYCIVIPGNHDLPYHNLDLLYESGLGVLLKAYSNRFRIYHANEEMIIHLKNFSVYGFPFSSSEGKERHIELRLSGDKVGKHSNAKMVVIHTFCYKGRKPNGIEAIGCSKLLKKFYEYDIIVCGDNHQSFTFRIGNHLLINPGCFSRQNTTEANYTPTVYLWYAEENTAAAVPVPTDKKQVFSFNNKKDKKNRVEAVIRNIKNWEVGLSFTQNMKNFLKKNKLSKAVEHKIWEVIGE